MRVRPWQLALLAVLIAGLAHALALAAPFEDAYITFRYAESWASGDGLRFNPGGDPVEGFSSLSWVALMAAASALGADVGRFAAIASIASGIALLALAGLAARRLGGARGMGIAFVPALVAATGTFGYWAGTGMETALFAALICAVCVGAGAGERRGAVIAGLCLAVAIATRPEAVVYAAAVIAAVALARGWRPALVVGIPPLVAISAITAWRLLTYGEPLPNTFYAKAEPSAALWSRGLAYVEALLTSHLLWLVVPAAVVVLGHRELRARLAPALAVIAAAIASSIVAGGDTFYFYRFMLPALAPIGLVLVGAGVVLTRDWRRSSRALGGSLAAAALLAMAPLASTGKSFALADKGRADELSAIERVARFNRDYFAVGRYLADQLEPDSVIAVNASGIVPYISGLETVDMLGLTDRHIAHRDIELGHGAAGHEKHDADYVLSREPDVIIIGLPVLVPRPPRDDAEMRAHLQRRSRHLPGDRALLASPELVERYRPVAVPVAGEYLVMLVRGPPEPEVAPGPSLIDAERLAALIAEPAEPQWFGVYLGERKIGHARLGLREGGAGEPDSIVAESSMSIAVSGDPDLGIEIDADRYYEREPPYRLLEVRVREKSDDGKTTLRYVRRARGMQVYRSVDGEPRRGRPVPASRETLETLVAQYLLEPTAVAEEETARLTELDIDSGRDRRIDVEVAERRTEMVFGVATEVAELAIRRDGDRAVTRTLIAAGGRTLRARIGRFELRAQDRRRAVSDVAGYDHLASAIAVDRDLGDPAEIARMQVSLTSSAEFSPPEAANQTVRRDGDRLELVITRGPGDPVTDDERTAALASSPEIDATAPAIQNLAAEIAAAGPAEPRAQIERLVRRVHETLAKRTSTNLSSASGVLAAGVGDCTEHTLLLVALARAMGIAAREVSGLVWAGDEAGRFAWHAWAEVELDGRWHRVDPSWGEVEANATHITLGVGGASDWLVLLGDLGIEVGEVDKGVE